MNKGFLQSSPVQQQMMAGNPNWWNINTMRPPLQQPSSPFFTTPTNSNLYPHYIPTSWHDHNQELPESWSQLLLGGLVGEEEKTGLSQFQQDKKLENWESQLLHHEPAALPNAPLVVVDVKQENSSANNYFYVHHDDQNHHHHHHHEDFQAAAAAKPTWSPVINQLPAASSSSPPPKSCVTSFSSNMLDFSNTKLDGRHPPPDRSSECNSTSTGGAVKKARVQPSSTQSPFKVRKEKLGDRITSLHQIVSPFGKTDTASVLLEAIGYIRFLQSQIEALSLPYLGSGSGNIRHQQSVQGERNCIFPEDPGQLLNDNCMKRKGASEQESYEEPKKDLRSRGLCLVPLSSTLQVGSDNGADYWAPALGGGGFR